MNRPSLPQALEQAAEELRRNPLATFVGPFASALAAGAIELNRLRAQERAAGAPPAQCLGCQLWQQRGGTIIPAAPGCVALEGDPFSAQARALLLSLAADMARAGRCPMAEPFPEQPDAYRAADLPTFAPQTPPPEWPHVNQMTGAQALAWGAAERDERMAELAADRSPEGLRRAQANAATRRNAIGATRAQAGRMVVEAAQEKRPPSSCPAHSDGLHRADFDGSCIGCGIDLSGGRQP